MDSSSLDFAREHNTFLNTGFVKYALVTLAALLAAGFLWVKRIG